MILSFGMVLGDSSNIVGKRMLNKIIEESSKKIKELAYESGKEVCSIGINLNAYLNGSVKNG